MKNKPIQKLILLSSLMLISILSVSAQCYVKINIFTKNGNQQTLPINGIRSLTFSNDKMNIHLKNGTADAIPFVDLTKMTFKVESGVGDTKKLSSLIQIYPNPVENYLNINCQNIQSDTDFRLQILSIDGKIVYNQKMSTNSDINKINVSRWKKGFYFVYIKTDKQVYTQKLIKK